MKDKLLYVCPTLILIMLMTDVSSSGTVPGLPANTGAGGQARPRAALSNKAQAPVLFDISKFKSLADAVSAIGRADAILLISDRQNIALPIAVPMNIEIRFAHGGQLVIAKNSTVTMNAPMDAGLNSIFSGEGLVEFHKTSTVKVFPQWWGARGDDVAEDTIPVQSAINAAARSGGGSVVISKGTYVVNALVLDSNVKLVGEGKDSILEQKKGAMYCCSVNPGAGGTPSIAGNKRDIVIQGIHFKGTVEKDGFQEHVHLLNINAASNVTISNCAFTGWRGDGIYVGSSNTAGVERHNKDITIEGCLFDGINNDNRNAISVIDGDGIKIRNNTFLNCTRQDMPGAIDVEPDANAFAIINDISITHNSFQNIGGNGGVIGVVLPLGQTILKMPAGNILIEGNTIGKSAEKNRPAIGLFLYQMQAVSDTTPSNNVTISKNIIRFTYRSFRLYGVRGVKITDNLFEHSLSASLVAFPGATFKCRDIAFERNTFRNLGIDDGSGIEIFDVDDIRFTNNTFDNIGPEKGGAGHALNFNRGTADRVYIVGNTFQGKRTTNAIHREPVNMTVPQRNMIKDNIFDVTGKGNFPGINGQ